MTVLYWSGQKFFSDRKCTVLAADDVPQSARSYHIVKTGKFDKPIMYQSDNKEYRITAWSGYGASALITGHVIAINSFCATGNSINDYLTTLASVTPTTPNYRDYAITLIGTDQDTGEPAAFIFAAKYRLSKIKARTIVCFQRHFPHGVPEQLSGEEVILITSMLSPRECGGIEIDAYDPVTETFEVTKVSSELVTAAVASYKEYFLGKVDKATEVFLSDNNLSEEENDV